MAVLFRNDPPSVGRLRPAIAVRLLPKFLDVNVTPAAYRAGRPTVLAQAVVRAVAVNLQGNPAPPPQTLQHRLLVKPDSPQDRRLADLARRSEPYPARSIFPR